MSAEGFIAELRKASPNTMVEFLGTGILLFMSTIILLRPDSIFGVKGIQPAPILQQPGEVGILLTVFSLVPLLLTQALSTLKDPFKKVVRRWVAENILN